MAKSIPKILFKYPCRGREGMFFESLNSLDLNIRDRDNYHISLTLDEDDLILNSPSVIGKINSYKNVSIQWGLSTSKVHAINRSMPDYDYDILVAWSNDMFATFYGIDDIFRTYMQHDGPEDFDFLAHFPEPDARDMLNVLYVATRRYYERFSYIYHPSYKSLFCDNESLHVAKALGRYRYYNIPGLFVHKNAAYPQYNLVRDELFNEQQNLWPVDENNFFERKKIKFGLTDEQIINPHYLL